MSKPLVVCEHCKGVVFANVCKHNSWKMFADSSVLLRGFHVMMNRIGGNGYKLLVDNISMQQLAVSAPSLPDSYTELNGWGEFMRNLDSCKGDLIRYAGALTRNPDRAEELYAETVGSALQSFWGYRGEGTGFPAWIRSVMRHSYYRGCRERQRHAHIGIEAVPHLTSRRLHNLIDDLLVIGTDGQLYLSDEFAAATGKVSDGDLEALRLHAFEETPYAEIAERLGITENAVRTRIFRARKVLTRELFSHA